MRRERLWVRWFILGLVAIFWLASPLLGAMADTKTDPKSFRQYYSPHLQSNVQCLPKVFLPFEAEADFLPYMADHKELFRDKTVLEIGTGSGIISLYAARLGAKKIIATDIDENAVTSARMNAEKMGFSPVIEVRHVSSRDISAYAVLKPDEAFDVIVSNPPYSIDLDAVANTSKTDKGDLGLSIVKGLSQHLRPGGTAVLLYKSFFYHQVMVQYAQHAGFDVQHYTPWEFMPWEADAILNSYLVRLLKHQNVPPDLFRFQKTKIYVQEETSSEAKKYNGLIILTGKT